MSEQVRPSASGGAPTDADYLVGTANGSLSAEIAVGTTPGGELGGTWASPTVDGTHSGSAHSDAIAKAIVDAKGDIIVATAADTVARLAVGTDAQVLTADSAQSTGLGWASLPAGAGTRVYNSGAFAVSASTETAVTFDTERSDSDAFHSTSSQTERLTVPSGKAGRYAIAGSVEWAASALGTLRRLSVRLNGTTYIAKDEITSIINAALPQNVATVYDLAVGDYVELVAFQDTVGSINLQASGNYSPEFGMSLAGVSAAAGATELLGLTAYNPGTAANADTASTSLADADANLTVTFTAPASGNVLINLSAVHNPDTGNAGGNYGFWGLRESTTNVAGPALIDRCLGTATAQLSRRSCSFRLSGLSAGSHTYKWAHCTGGSGTTRIRFGGTATGDLGGAAVMEVWAAP